MNVIIVHGGNDSEKEAKEDLPENKRHWMPWIKQKLEEKGISVSNNLYPHDWAPDYKEWKNIFETNKISQDTILIGHSDGGAFLVRWLGETKNVIDKLILVAQWKILEDKNDLIRKEFYNFEINEDIKDNIKEIVIFTSDDEELNGKKSVKIYHERLGGKLIELKDRGHFTEQDMRTKEFPELLNEVLR